MLNFSLLAQDAPATGGMAALIAVAIVLAVFIVPFLIGHWLAKAARMPDYGWKIGLVLWAISASASAIYFRWPPTWGVDLRGGVILVYEIDETQAQIEPETPLPDVPQRNASPQDRLQVSSAELVQALNRRLNPEGLKEIVVRPFGERQVEIIVPEVDPAEIAHIKKQIENAGFLEFMIVANNETKDAHVIQAARDQSADPLRRLDRFVRDSDGEVIGFWARAGREQNAVGGIRPLKVPEVVRDVIRDAFTGDLLDLSRQSFGDNREHGFERYLAQEGIREIDVLMRIDRDYEVKGSDLGTVNATMDQSLSPAIEFRMKGEGAIRMGQLTGENLPNPERKLGIVLDGQLITAPVIRGRITDQGQITGRFTQEEVDLLVGLLRTGRLPAVLKKQPESENQIGSILGQDTIVKGSWSILISFLVVFGFMAMYYRFAGVVACGVLAVNVLMTVAIMMLVRAPFTMAGLAGLVLTVGMSVDSNVLIYERMREELARGAALRMAIRNGFDRAMVTIIDSNLTTLLTAVVLYAIGTDQVRGFATTLILGIITSMFTACFAARVVFDVAERTRLLTQLHMFKLLTKTSVDFVAMFKPAMVVSAIFIVVGIAATVARGRSLFDIEFNGGTSIAFTLTEPMPDDQVRARLAAIFADERDDSGGAVSDSLNPLGITGQQANTTYKVDTSLTQIDRLEKLISQGFRDEQGNLQLKAYRVDVGPLATRTEARGSQPAPDKPATNDKPATENQPATDKPEPTDKPADKSEGSEKKQDATPEGSQGSLSRPLLQFVALQAEEPADAESADDKPADDKPAQGKKPATEDKPAEDKPAEEKGADKKPAAEDKPAENKKPAAEEEPAVDKKPATAEKPAEDKKPATEEKPAEDKKPAGEKPAEPAPSTEAPQTPSAPAPATPAPPRRSAAVITEVELKFPGAPITAQALADRIRTVAETKFGETPDIRVSNPSYVPGQGAVALESWKVELSLGEERSRQLLSEIEQQMEDTPVWQSLSKIGVQVAGDAQSRALIAVFFSLLGIAAYVWFRFNQLSWGVAAVASLVHDALVMLSCIALSYWLASALGFLMIEEFKINLTVVAAFLTLIGYSINDTIVIFDRIREIRGKDPNLTGEMINVSVNQTLSRTILTGGLTLLTVVILYVGGGPGIHAFAFAMVVGVISGTYSTVFIAAPMLLWMLGRKKGAAA